MTPVLILRPEPGASVTATYARTLGLAAIVAPLFKIEPVEWTPPDPAGFDALLLTSANAMRFGGPALSKLRALPVHAVGRATARAAIEAGFSVANVGDGDVEALMKGLDGGLRLLHLAGAHHRPPSRARDAISVVSVYCSAEIADVDWRPPRIEVTVALIHSPRSARIFADRVDARGANRGRIAIAAISPAAAEALGDGWRSVEVAVNPGDDELLALAARLCEMGAGE